LISPGTYDSLAGVAAISARNAWAVGFTSSTGTQALIVHWDGSAWTQVPSPALAGGGLSGVAATPARNVWAVGAALGGSGYYQTLIEHWNGRTWKRVPSPARGESHEVPVLARQWQARIDPADGLAPVSRTTPRCGTCQ
jgi:hypothetical protein